MLDLFQRALREAGWAPVAVCLIALLVCDPASGTQYWTLHFAGGAAVAFFFYQAAREAHVLHGRPAPIEWRRFAFLAACASASAWEIGEFVVDDIAGTMLQKGLQDTAGDLAFGMLGAVAILKVGRPAVRRARSLYRRR